MSVEDAELNSFLSSRVRGFARRRQSQVRTLTWAQTDRCLWCYTDFGTLRKRLNHQKDAGHPQYFQPAIGPCGCGEHHENWRTRCAFVTSIKDKTRTTCPESDDPYAANLPLSKQPRRKKG